jgi:hypothetical protein
MSQINN